jgi:hypothetical protein
MLTDRSRRADPEAVDMLVAPMSRPDRRSVSTIHVRTSEQLRMPLGGRPERLGIVRIGTFRASTFVRSRQTKQRSRP